MSETVEMRCSKPGNNSVVSLLRNNHLAWLDSELNLLESIDTGVEAQLYSFDLSYARDLIYAQSGDKLFLIDRRMNRGKTCLCSASDAKSPFSKFYAIKTFKDQYYLAVNNRYVSFYDIRSPSFPILNINHHMEYNPPEIVEFSKCEEDYLSVDAVMDSFLQNFDKRHENFEYEKRPGLLSLFSAHKNGLAIFLPIDRDFVFEQSELGSQFSQNLYHEKNHFIKLSKNIEPVLFYSSNFESKRKKLTGHKVLSLAKSLNLVFQSDSLGNLYFQNLAFSDEGFLHTKIKSDLKSQGDTTIDESIVKSMSEKFMETKSAEELNDSGNSLWIQFPEFYLEDPEEALTDPETLKKLQLEERKAMEELKNIKKIDLALRDVYKSILKEGSLSKVNEAYDLEVKMQEDGNQAEVPADLKISEMNDFENKIFNDDFVLEPQTKSFPSYYNSGYIITENLEGRLKSLWE